MSTTKTDGLDAAEIGRDFMALFEKHQIPVALRASFLIGFPVGALKAQGLSDDAIWEFVKGVVEEALGGAREELEAQRKPSSAMPRQAAPPMARGPGGVPRPQGIPKAPVARPPAKGK